MSPFIWLGGGYRVIKHSKFPNIWLAGSYLYSDIFDQEELPFNKLLSTPGAGLILGMKSYWLKKSFINFSINYYPVQKTFYKSMQAGWEIKTIGFTAGGL